MSAIATCLGRGASYTQHFQVMYSIYVVEPLLKDTLNKGHNTFNLSLYKGQVLWSLQDHGNTILPLQEDNLCITVKL